MTVLDDRLQTVCQRCKHRNKKEVVTCKAFPNGIPRRYALKDDHFDVDADQVGDYTFSF